MIERSLRQLLPRLSKRKNPAKAGFLTFNASELLRYVGRSYDGLTAAKAAFSVALGRMTRFTVSRLAW